MNLKEEYLKALYKITNQNSLNIILNLKKPKQALFKKINLKNGGPGRT